MNSSPEIVDVGRATTNMSTISTGFTDGALVVGISDGLTAGAGASASEGVREGNNDGQTVENQAAPEGERDGTCDVGETVGWLVVGSPEGEGVGAFVEGTCDGAEVGSALG